MVTQTAKGNIRPRAKRAFTLIELIGVMAVIAVLAGVLVTVVVKRVDQAARLADASELSAMAASLQTAILRTGQIPSQTGIVPMLATEMQASADRIATNSRGVARIFVVDPNFSILAPPNNFGGTVLYDQVQTPFGSGTINGDLEAPGLSLRMIIVSSLMSSSTAPMPAITTSGEFNAVWNTPEGSVPSGWSAAWNNHGEDLKIQRLDLTSLFHQVTLNPIDTNNLAAFSIACGTSFSAIININQNNFLVPYATICSNSWYLQGTALSLFDLSGGRANIEFQTVIQNDSSYVFENSAWHPAFSGGGNAGPPSTCPDVQFQLLATALTNSASNPKSLTNGIANSDLLASFYRLMLDYDAWLNQGTPAAPDFMASTTLPQDMTNISLTAASLAQ